MTITTFIFFLAIIVGTLLITYWAAKQTTSTTHYYTAGGQLSGYQNGLAIAGDYMSAASFLGVSGAFALYGFDGFFYTIGFLVSYLVLLLFIAEPMRNLGEFTMGDVIAARFPAKKTRLCTAISTQFISILYMVAQLVAAGSLIKLLLGVDYEIAVIVVGALMTLYVVFGGMMATSWIQIVKTMLLLTGVLMVCLIVLSRFNFNVFQFIEAVRFSEPFREGFLYPGNLFKNPVDTISLQMSLLLGAAGLPHILIRFLTVKDAITVRTSVISAIGVIGIFYIMTIILGFGALLFVGWEYLKLVDESGNMSAPLLAFSLGGDFLMAFISAIAFATILAVVSGIIICASASFAHDFYRHVLCNGKASERAQMEIAKLAAAGVGCISILFALLVQHLNVAAIVSLIFAFSASVHFPLIFLSLYWKGLTAIGAIAGMITGFLSSTILVIISPNMMGVFFGESPLFPLYNPGIISIPLSFLVAMITSYITASKQDQERFERVFVQGQTGIEQKL
ncbi:cation acetate symporter [Anaerobacillus sp. MEB173]|uniref:solute symporter family protein n=1 Tax=Anaerobacillus sp. MEB173 TaxID=3383345 RepID=UPI003F911DDD